MPFPRQECAARSWDLCAADEKEGKHAYEDGEVFPVKAKRGSLVPLILRNSHASERLLRRKVVRSGRIEVVNCQRTE